MKKIFSIFGLILAIDVFSDDFFFNTPNNNGTLGVFNIPSARFYSSPAGSITFYRGTPDRKISVSLYPYDWLEASIFYSSIKGKVYPGFNQDYKDKGFNLKLRLFQRENMPSLAVGFNDIGGTGYYSSEYLVSSYSFNKYDFHLGAAWGTLNHHDHLKNPFSYISDDFSDRNYDLNQGGQLNTNNFFSGHSFSIFGGINYVLSNNLILGIEHDPTKTPGKVGYKQRNSDMTYGLKYLRKKYTASLSIERGSNISFNISLRDDFFIPKHKFEKSKKNITRDRYINLINTLNANNIGVSKIEKKQNTTYLTLTQYKHNYQELTEIINKSLIENDFKEEVVKSYQIVGLDVIDNTDKSLKDTLYKNKLQRNISHKFSTRLRPFIAGREDFIKFAYLLEHDAEIILKSNLLFSTNLKVSLLDNFDDLTYPPVNTYPEQVRSDIKRYLNNLGENISIGRAQFEYFKTIKTNNHLLLTAGIFEEMFSGYGFEYLKFNPKSRINWGFEASKVYKRGYKFNFDLLDYTNTTYFFNLFYKFRKGIPFDAKLSFGEYLAGDKGMTIELSRSFRNGISMGFFASKTDVSADQFGEGSFDKGIFFNIPFSLPFVSPERKISNFTWRPLTKDPASKLIKRNDLYSLVNRYSVIAFD